MMDYGIDIWGNENFIIKMVKFVSITRKNLLLLI